MQHLLFEGYSVAGAVYGHDPNYFVPEKDDKGRERFYYEFGQDRIKIPLSVFTMRENPSIAVYEVIRSLKPDLVITVGDHKDYLYMKAIKAFERDFKWLVVLMNHSAPISEENAALFEDVDAVLCTSQFARDSVNDLFKKEIIETAYIGSGASFKPAEGIEPDPNRFRVMTCNKTAQSDQVAALIEAVAGIRKDIPEIELYLHSNVYDNGEYDLNQLKDQFDPDDEYISLPDKYVSVFEGIPDDELAVEMSKSDVFTSISMTAGASMSVFDAVACGCYPLMSDCGSHRDVAALLADHLSSFQIKDFLVPCTRLMERDGGYLSICDPKTLGRKILSVYENRKKHEGLRTQFAEFRHNRGHEDFLRKLSDMIKAVPDANSVCLETV
jgi:hypothetical protein